ncbi:DNA phosphorothioation-associated putative methyltransferase [Candidatus Protofrankia californiensis]|uniref:DNA phosphorothioation-associated putative methyltransferase n=1 Tax=Candidatus Protofrankia californiensis TaxID=1839754 RepID=UPI00104126C0|nr:DNA phosphorothioation-associated putative methyltransferase [Candidatus Protofrankia californiensis]
MTTRNGAPTIRRERTAMARTGLSVPARQALADKILDGRTVLDYGCGKGGDMRRLAAADITISGWDPHYKPHPLPSPADVVLLTYVLNVIEDPAERAHTLVTAWQLARECLVVAVRTHHDARRLHGTAHRDGLLTSRGTFQVLSHPETFATWAQQVVPVRAVTARPGQLYLFRTHEARARYLAHRYSTGPDLIAGSDTLADLASWLRHHGRPPKEDEAHDLYAHAEQRFGTLTRATKAASELLAPEELDGARRRRKTDLLVVLAMDAFHGRSRLSDLPPTLQHDARFHFGTYHEASRRADQLLAALSQPAFIRRATHASRIGKLTPTALYVHTDCEPSLSAALRVYIACAELVAGRPPLANILKLHHDRPAVSFLEYPEFDAEGHPRLATSTLVNLAQTKVETRDYTASANRPILHRKEEFLPSRHPRRDLYARLTKREVAAGLYTEPHLIGTEQGWTNVLEAAGLHLKGHRIVRD